MRLRKNAKIDLIKRVPLFAHCSRRDLDQIASIADEIDLPGGKELTREGAPGREFFILVEGDADVRKNRRRIDRLGPGDFFGEIALLEQDRRTASVVARTPMRVVVMHRRDFQHMEREMPRVAEQVREAMRDRAAR